MKQRVISGVIIGVIALVLTLIGGRLFDIASIIMAIYGSYEFISSRGTKINLLELIPMMIYVLLVNLIPEYYVSFTLILLVFEIGASVFKEEISFDNACITIIEAMILGFAFLQMREIEALNKFFLGYFIIVAFLTDVFALFAGMKFGKHKLNERVSPKKTIEGAIGGWACGAIISFIWASIFNYFNMNILLFVVCSLVLPIVSQIGDLAFSLIKRHFKTKDFSNLIPGHGGLLDRLDSLIFTLIIFRAIYLFFI